MSDTENNAPAPAEEVKTDVVEMKEKEEPMAIDIGGSGDHKDAHKEVEEEEEPKEESTEEDDEKKEDLKDEQVKSTAPKPQAKATPKKVTPQKRKRKETESEEEEDGEEEEPKLGLLEQPVTIVSGKRERKKVEHLDVSSSYTPKDKAELEIPEGKGTKLGDIENVQFQLNRTKAEELKALHRFCYSKAGASKVIKSNLRKFCGFGFTEGSAEYEKKVAMLTKLTTAQLKQLCEWLDLERSGQKEALVSRLMEYGLRPEASGKPLPKGKRGKSKSSKGGKPKKKKGATKKKDDKKEKGSPKKKAKSAEEVNSSESEEDGNDDEEDGDEEGEENEKSEDEGSEEEDSDKEPPKKKKKTEAKKPEKKPEKKPAPKKPAEKKKATPKKKQESDDDDDDSSDDEPLVPKKSPPTEDELKDCIKKILEGANLEEITMKTVCKQVYAKYPDFDLSNKKDFIKSTVKSIIR